MTDPRLIPANDRVAASFLRGQVSADQFVEGAPARVQHPVVDLCATPDGARARQLLLGSMVHSYETRNGWDFVQAADGYVGYCRSEALGTSLAPTHRVGTLATHLYRDPDFKSPDLAHLGFGAQLVVVDERHKFFETPGGFVPKKHLRPLDRPFSDPATVAQLHFGVPYLWGGNSTLGLDCSGLISAALTACDIPCPGDSDLQCADLGRDLETDAPLARGDLLFWPGHVGMMVDDQTLIHANAHHMAVTYEPIAQAILRIETQGDGAVQRRARL